MPQMQNSMLTRGRRLAVAQRGFTLVELMIAITLALFVIAGLIALFLTSSRSTREIDAGNRQIENGQYALRTLGLEFAHAGFFGQFNPDAGVIATPAVMPDPCATSAAALIAALPVHIQGFDDAATLGCIPQAIRPGSDVVVVRRAAVCVTDLDPTADCAVVSGVPYFQASSCQGNLELGSPDVGNHFRLTRTRAALDRTRRDCVTTAEDRRYVVHIFYLTDVANNPVSPGEPPTTPTLMRAELGATGFTSIPIATGIEAMQLEYGIDTDGDGTPDAFTADPNTYAGCAAAACVEHWRDTVAVKVYLVARTQRLTAGHVDGKAFSLGSKADGSPNVITPANDPLKRHLYQTLARLNNPSMRRE